MTKSPRFPALRIEGDAAIPKQARSVEKRRRLLEAGRILFGEKGYEAASVEAIAAKAGAATGAFYQYFNSKRQFLVALMAEFIEHLAKLDLRPQGAADVRTGLHNFLARAFRVDTEYFGVIRAWQEAVPGDPELAALQEEIETWTRARVLGVFEMLRRLPNARTEVDPAAFARLMDRHFWSLLGRGSRISRRELNQELKLAADVIYFYLFRDSQT